MYKIIDKVWELLTLRYFSLLCLLLISAVSFATVISALPVDISLSWWSIALRQPTALAIMVLLGFLATMGWLCRAFETWQRHRSGEKVDFSRSQLLGTLLIIVGIAVVGGDWAISQRGIPPTRVTLGSGKWFQEYRAQSTGVDVGVMLESEVSLAGIRTEARPPAVDIRFRKDRMAQPDLQLLSVFQPLLVENNYWTLIGTEYSVAAVRAVIVPNRKNAIAAAGGVGDELQFTINGPKYTIQSILFDEYPELGPTVRLEDEGGTQFTVFMKPKGDKENESRLPSLGHEFWITEIEAAPLATLMIAPNPPIEMMLTGLLIAVVGLMILLVTSDSSVLLGVKVGGGKQEVLFTQVIDYMDENEIVGNAPTTQPGRDLESKEEL